MSNLIKGLFSGNFGEAKRENINQELDKLPPRRKKKSQRKKISSNLQLKEITEAAAEYSVPTLSFRTLDQAMGLLPGIAPAGHHILFSPACASQDEFVNFEERGHFFSNKIKPFLDEAHKPEQ